MRMASEGKVTLLSACQEVLLNQTHSLQVSTVHYFMSDRGWLLQWKPPYGKLENAKCLLLFE